jgi:hypothetical protein
VLRPGIREKFARDIQTYEWAAAQVEGMGGEAARLRPRLVIETFKRWTARELDLRRGLRDLRAGDHRLLAADAAAAAPRLRDGIGQRGEKRDGDENEEKGVSVVAGHAGAGCHLCSIAAT